MKRKVIYKVNIMALLVFLPVMLFMCKNSKYSDFIINDAEGIQEPITPTVTTNEVTDITITSAICGGNVIAAGGAEVTARGICWSTSQNPTITDSLTTDSIGLGSFISSITGLSAGATYYVRAYATNEVGTVYGEEKTFTTKDGIAEITTKDVTDITRMTARCGGNIVDDGGADITARGVCWSTNQNPTITGSHTTDGSGTGSYTSDIAGLTENTKYYVRAYATNEVGTVYGEEKTFTTKDGIAEITTKDVTDITSMTARCGGNIVDDGGADITARGVCWSMSQNPTISDSHTTDGSGIGSFTSDIAELTENTKYYVRAYATNEVGTVYGEEKTFTTKYGGVAEVVTNEVSDITTTTAKCGGNVINDGGYEINARGVCWSTNQNSTISDSHTTDGSGTGSFTSNITGLTKGTTYYVRAYATNEVGTVYGEEKTFITKDGIAEITTNDVTEITETTAVCGGEVTDDGGATVTARGVCWSTSQNPTITGSHTTDGSGTGSYTSNITGLNAGTTYYVRAYATNSEGTSYGSQKSFTTTQHYEPPTVTTNNVTGITETTAVCGGNVTADGGAMVTARGVCWSTSQNPTITGSHTTDGSGTGSYTSNITGLNTGTTYYVRAYATNSGGTSYGSRKSFTTNGQINGHEYVDLGLPSGVKWATCNVGANSSSEYGKYYAWGEIAPKTSYDAGNSVTYGQEMGDISGNPQYDAARANWGGTWRIPTKAEFEELKYNCTWTWTNEGGNRGYRVTGANGNNIFFPAAGNCEGISLNGVGSEGYYWSSTPHQNYIQYASDLLFYSSDYLTVWSYRYLGQSVRPVSD